MLLTVTQIKTAMGLENPEQDDSVIDPKVEEAILSAQALVSSYIGMNVEVQGDPESYILHQPSPFRSLNLPKYPVSMDEAFSVAIDGKELSEDTDYSLQYRNGIVTFTRQYNAVKKIEVQYSPGFDSFTAPQDLKMALQNISIAIYNLPPGGFGASSGVGPLKSMTMFDAMSMSFDTTADAAAASTPQGMVGQWSFVLDKFKVDKYVMAGVS